MVWIKLNFDGARFLVDDNVVYDGVLRDHYGIWVCGFFKFVRRCSTLEVELRRMTTRLKIAWDMGFRQLVVKADNMDAIKVLRNQFHKRNLISLINYVRDLCQQEWRVSFAHIVRRNNRVTGRLAKLISDSNLDVVLYDVPLSVVLSFLRFVDVV
ncbi:hypothetical protein V6N11_064496 [Hibiscus sabdariffa]|uniref:RNase H type-1 domain-containing protein n=1 Tax=Hibiscus sabdariffa TaxID=183260 RepID=A0ABR1ZFK0_9ROSI